MPSLSVIRIPIKQDFYLNPNKISILMVSDLPWWLVINVGAVRNRNSLAEVDQPDAGLTTVVDKEQRATNQLKKMHVMFFNLQKTKKG